MYHSIDESKSCISVSAASFQRQMMHLKKSGYRTISLSGLYRAIIGGERINERSVVITFDDGYRNNYSYAFRIMERYGFTATIFLTTDYIGKKAEWMRGLISRILSGSDSIFENGSISKIDLDFLRRRLPWFLSLGKKKLHNELYKIGIASNLPMLSWDEIQEMNRFGIDFGAHTCCHPFLSDLPLEQARREIQQSKNTIEQYLDKPVEFFSYPYGDLNGEIRQMVKDAGFLGACGIEMGVNDKHSDIYALKRIPVGDKMTGFRFCFSRAFNWYTLLRIYSDKIGTKA